MLHLPSGGSETFRLPLHADRPVRVVADQIGIDVSLELTSPAGEVIETVADRSSGLEVLVAIVPKAGTYRLEVAAASEKLPAGDVDLRVDEFGDTPGLRAAARRHQDARAIAAQGKDRRRDARREFEAARDAWAGAGDEIMAAWALEEIGELSILIPEPVAARLAYTEAARRFAAAGRTADQALAQYGAGHALHQQGDYAGACAQWKATFPLEGALTPSDRVDLRYAYAADLKEQGDYDAALPMIGSALETYRDLGMLTEELTAQSELGSIHLMLRDTVRALDALTRGVARSRETARPDMEARFLQRLAVLEWEIGDRDAAAEQATRALALYRQAGNHVAEGAVLVLLGDVLGRRDDLDGAEANYRRALDLFRGAGSQAGEARALSRLGLLLSKRGDFAHAIEIQERAVDMVRKSGDRQGEVSKLINLGRTRADAGERVEARRVFNQALALTRESGAGFAEEDLLGELALLDVAEGALDRALASFDQILARLEARQRAALVPGIQVPLAGDAQQWYAARTDLLMRRHQAAPRAGWDAKALESAERGRARVLLGMLAESRIDLREGVDPDRLARYREAQVRLAGAATDAAKVEASQAVQAIEAEIRKANPAYAALTLPVPLTLDDIRRRVLDDDTVLLEFAPGVKRGWLFAVTREGLVTAELPDFDVIDAAAERLYTALAARPGGAPATAGDATAESAALSAKVLGPIAGRLAGAWKTRRLVVVPSTGLAPIPFGALIVPGAGSGRRLLDDHEIVDLPSATVIDVMRRVTARRPAAEHRVALIGDPVFSADDPRVAGGTARPAAVAARAGETPAPVTPAAAVSYPRLPFSREEVRSIAALLPEGEALEAVDFRATRSLATGGGLSGCRIVHFATHGVIDTAHPDLSGLVLSLVDEAGRPQDGYLRLQEIYNLRLSADLVVLSACRSALGRRIAGEGLIGLARGFMHAGAPRVVASLWQVDDSATSELMTRFYRGMIADGLRPADALRRAQIGMSRDPRWAAPFYWAGFTLEGEWR